MKRALKDDAVGNRNAGTLSLPGRSRYDAATKADGER